MVYIGVQLLSLEEVIQLGQANPCPPSKPTPESIAVLMYPLFKKNAERNGRNPLATGEVWVTIPSPTYWRQSVDRSPAVLSGALTDFGY